MGHASGRGKLVKRDYAARSDSLRDKANSVRRIGLIH